MVTMAQVQVQAEHSFAKGRSGGLAVCGLSSFCLLLTGRLADPGVGAVFVSLSACLLIPAQALAGLKLAQGKMRHKIHPALCAFHITHGIAQAGDMASPVECGLLAQRVGQKWEARLQVETAWEGQ